LEKVNSMLIIINKNLPEPAKHRLADFGNILELETENIVDKYLSGHPDIFFSYVDNKLIYSPSLPDEIKNTLKIQNIITEPGKTYLKSDYPYCAGYNCLVTNKLLIHKSEITDPVVKLNCREKNIINVNQGMTRCSTVAITENAFITSDNGIYNTLSAHGYEILLVKTEGIQLPGQSYGLFGGTCGVFNNNLFIAGSLDHYIDGKRVSDFCKRHTIKVIELYDGPLFDGGSILFINN
jgi:hypothetical protein